MGTVFGVLEIISFLPLWETDYADPAHWEIFQSE